MAMRYEGNLILKRETISDLKSKEFTNPTTGTDHCSNDGAQKARGLTLRSR